MAYTIKTTRSDTSVEKFLDSIENTQRKEDSFVMLELLKNITKKEPSIWGDSIVGFCPFSYTTKSGCTGEWFSIGFSPRKNALTVYVGYDIISDTSAREKLGKHTAGKACLYIKKLSDINIEVLASLLKKSMKKPNMYSC